MVMDTSFSFLPGLSFDQPPETMLKHANRIVYGSDFPNLIMPREEEIEKLLSFDLGNDFYNKIFRNNADRLIKECCPKSQD